MAFNTSTKQDEQLSIEFDRVINNPCESNILNLFILTEQLDDIQDPEAFSC